MAATHLQFFTVSRDDSIYEAWPDVALTTSEHLVCVFAECTHHADRGYTRIMHTRSEDRGRTWSPKQPLTEPLRGEHQKSPYWDNPRIVRLRDGGLCVLVDIHYPPKHYGTKVEVFAFFSQDEGKIWSQPVKTPIQGGGLDRLLELKSAPHQGRWVVACHQEWAEGWNVDVYLTEDHGTHWEGPFRVARDSTLKFCEPSVVEMPSGELVCFLRENSKLGYDVFKCISRDGGRTWSAPTQFPVPACHRPVAGILQNGMVLITHRYAHHGKGWLGWWTQNTFAAFSDPNSCLQDKRNEAQVRIMPIDYDRSPVADCGYTGWVQFQDGEIYVVNYIVDDAPKAQIRGYSFHENDILFSQA